MLNDSCMVRKPTQEKTYINSPSSILDCTWSTFLKIKKKIIINFKTLFVIFVY